MKIGDMIMIQNNKPYVKAEVARLTAAPQLNLALQKILDGHRAWLAEHDRWKCCSNLEVCKVLSVWKDLVPSAINW